MSVPKSGQRTSVQAVQRAVICVAATDALNTDAQRILAAVVLPHTDVDRAHLAVLDVREAILRGRDEQEIEVARGWWAKADELAYSAALQDRMEVSA